MRMYTAKPSLMPAFMKLVAEVGIPVRGNKHGTLVGAWTSDIGQLNRYYHLWSYPDAGERMRLRAGLATLTGWFDDYIPRMRPMVTAQQNELWYADEEIG